MKALKIFTSEHLNVACRAMPRKVSPLWLGEKRDKQFKSRSRRERKCIADYYRFLRKDVDGGHGPIQARRAHRYGLVVTGTEAKVRLRNMQPSPNSFHWNR